ncbi:phosphatidylinositol-glycan biosynthesis class X protein-like isoform X2 [Zingiber officinale]|uniref:phosphatidylinositol-glycan biosynthesis class X protein-like isoform X2 n=1 Tax=Zingiber officinale TaxID=94328 RepID=UPI001C4C4E96|nr:phosphatidylinositol-glycan biosynthesis class X protein-like isoform X2 [Zingiber officinale]
MKFLENTPLDSINLFLNHLNLGESTIKGNLEAFSWIMCHLTMKNFVLFLFIFMVPSIPKANSYNENVDLAGNNSPRFVGCWPCFWPYLASSFLQHGTTFESDFHGYLAQEFGISDTCKGLASNIGTLGILNLDRKLNGEGSHRHIISTLRFLNQADINSLVGTQECEAVIIERLPVGIFADPFELQHLVNHKVYSDVAVFGDKNLELPSSLSNRSIVEIHMIIGNENSSSAETIVQLPLHARYPPLDGSGYMKVKLESPELFLRCRPKSLKLEPCLWTLIELNANAGSVKTVAWHVPAGNDAHRNIVAIATFASALICALSVFVFTIYFSKNNFVLVPPVF